MGEVEGRGDGGVRALRPSPAPLRPFISCRVDDEMTFLRSRLPLSFFALFSLGPILSMAGGMSSSATFDAVPNLVSPLEADTREAKRGEWNCSSSELNATRSSTDADFRG